MTDLGYNGNVDNEQMNSSSIVEYWSLLPLAVCPSLECFPFFQPCFPSSSLSTLVSQLSHLISSRSSPSKSQTHPQTVFGWNCPASRWRLERSVSQSTCISTHVQGLNTSCRLFRQILDRYATRRLLPPTPPGHRRLTDTTQLGAKKCLEQRPRHPQTAIRSYPLWSRVLRRPKRDVIPQDNPNHNRHHRKQKGDYERRIAWSANLWQCTVELRPLGGWEGPISAPGVVTLVVGAVFGGNESNCG